MKVGFHSHTTPASVAPTPPASVGITDHRHWGVVVFAQKLLPLPRRKQRINKFKQDTDMKKALILLSSALVLLSVSACGPKQSAYRQVYEKAKQREVAAQQKEPVMTPPANVVVAREPAADIQLRRERLEAVKGEDANMLKTYNVVVGSFQNHTNAYSLKERLQAQGYNPVLGQNEAGMLRVIITSFDNRREAEASREQVKGRFAPDFQDAWILEKIR